MIDKNTFLDIDKVVEKEKQTIVNFLQDLIEIPSVNPEFTDLKKYTGEAKGQEYLAEKLSGLGGEVNTWEPDPKKLEKFVGYPGYYPDRDFSGRPNLAAVFPGQDPDAPSLLLAGHIDTVNKEGKWNHPAFKGTIENNKIYGLGSADMKGGLTAMVMALHSLYKADYQPRGKVIFASVVDEEAGGMGTLDFVEQGYRADAGILAEPTALKVAPLCRGILWGKIKVEGRGGHIEIDQPHWQNGGAVDGIKKARFILNQIDRLNEEWAKKKRHDLLPIPCQVVSAQVSGGEYPTSYANEVEITFNAQYLPEEKDDKGAGSVVKKEIEDFIQQVASTDKWLAKNQPEIEWNLDANCGETSADHDFVQKLLDHNKEVIKPAGINTNLIEGVTSHTDMGFFTERGVNMINYGPGQPFSAHQPNEYVSIDELITATKVMARAIIDWTGIR